MSVKKSECLLRLFYKYGFNISSIKSAWNLLLGSSKLIKINLSSYKYPFFLRRKGSDVEVFFEIMLMLGYNFKTKLNYDPKVIVDCGANIGLASIYFKSRFPDSKIVAIEPEKNNFDLMKKNLDAYENVICENIGVWNKEAFVGVKSADSTDWGFSFQEVDEGTAGSVKALSIRDIMEKHSIEKIDILKIDIEGAEKEVFSSDYSYWMDRTQMIIVELHDRSVEGCSKAFFDALTRYNFSTEIRGENLFCFIEH